MTKDQINHEANSLAKTVICSLKDNKSARSWLEANEKYYPKGDQVVSKALEKVRKTLKSENFNLKEYKKNHK